MSNQAAYIRDIIGMAFKGAEHAIKEAQDKYTITPKVIDLNFPHDSPKFMLAWHTLCAEPKWKKKTKYALQLSLNKMINVSEPDAILMILQSIECSYQGIFPVSKPKAHVTRETQDRTDAVNRAKETLARKLHPTGNTGEQ